MTDLLKMQGNGSSELTAIFYTFYAIGSLLLIIVIIHMCVFNKRRCFIDRISDTVVIKMVDVSSKDLSSSLNTGIKKSKRNYGLPGEIIGSPADEIDGL
ncbi:hypothetical protein FACS1894166_01960 [Bacilli bacterium]|nr:hypothetical protein FACS1894166_01960 [Bacilli bacterium]